MLFMVSGFKVFVQNGLTVSSQLGETYEIDEFL